MKDSLEDILGQNVTALRLGAVQLDRLRRLTGSFNSVICWDGAGAVSAPAAAIVVIEAAHATRVQTLVNSLHENSIVIVPFSENPAFESVEVEAPCAWIARRSCRRGSASCLVGRHQTADGANGCLPQGRHALHFIVSTGPR